MLAVRDQENLVHARQNGASLKQQQGRQLQPKTPGARYPKTPIKVPLNDENATHVVGGAKSNLAGRTRGNENALTSKASKGLDKSNFVTPMGPRSRAVLGDKTTNAKAKALQPVNVKSAPRDIEKSHANAPTPAVPKSKQPQAESHKLEVHAEEADHPSEDEVEYCPPRPKDLPYESDVFPDGVLTFEGLKRENLFRGYYDYYINPIDEHGVSLSDRQLEEKNRRAMEECDRRVKEDIENFEWSIEDELEEAGFVMKKRAATPVSILAKSDEPKQPPARKAPPTILARNVAAALAMDDTTRSLQRRMTKPTGSNLPKKKVTSLTMAGLRSAKLPTTRLPVISRKTSPEIKNIEATSRTTIGYRKGRTTASALAQNTTTGPGTARPKSAIPRSDTTTSNDSDKTITPARYAQTQATAAAAEDQEWKQRVAFLSIFNPEEEEDEDDDYDLLAGGLPKSMCEEEDEEFELKLAD
ncbi:hypothetical protein DL769_007743 [Monosporascus sp. CRB-8-3]|nr:hypothetical protein DL769_007743 [Monosporascus sp. CRB-8-3]